MVVRVGLTAPRHKEKPPLDKAAFGTLYSGILEGSFVAAPLRIL